MQLIIDSGELVPAAYVLVAGTLIYWIRVRRYRADERRVLLLSLLLHVVATIILIAITSTKYGIGDMFGYARRGSAIADAISTDLWAGLRGLWGMTTAADLAPPFSKYGGHATTTFQALVGGILYMAGGSFVAGSLLFTFFSSFGLTSLYDGLRQQLPQSMHRRILWSMFFLPSYLMWASGLVKEAAAVALLGFALGNLLRFASTPYPSRALSAAIAALALTVLRPFVAIALAIGVAVWTVARGRGRTQRVKRAAIATALGTLLLVLGAPAMLTELRELSADLGTRQAAALEHAGGSTITWGELGSTTLSGQLTNLPGGLLNVWTRPWPTDVNSVFSAGSALQMMTILGLGVTAVWRRRQLALVENPSLLFLLVTGFASSVAVALGSTNLGSIDRYRVPALLLSVPVLVVLATSPREVGPPRHSRQPLAVPEQLELQK